MKKLMTEWRKYIKEEKMADLDAEQAYSTKVRGVNVIINLKDTDLQATRHSKERQFRHDEKISNRAIIQAVELAIGKIIQDYANGELASADHTNMERLVITKFAVGIVLNDFADG